MAVRGPTPRGHGEEQRWPQRRPGRISRRSRRGGGVFAHSHRATGSRALGLHSSSLSDSPHQGHVAADPPPRPNAVVCLSSCAAGGGPRGADPAAAAARAGGILGQTGPSRHMPYAAGPTPARRWRSPWSWRLCGGGGERAGGERSIGGRAPARCAESAMKSGSGSGCGLGRAQRGKAAGPGEMGRRGGAARRAFARRPNERERACAPSDHTQPERARSPHRRRGRVRLGSHKIGPSRGARIARLRAL